MLSNEKLRLRATRKGCGITAATQSQREGRGMFPASAFVFVQSRRTSTHAESWVRCAGTLAGWTAYAHADDDPQSLGELWSRTGGCALTAVVGDDHTCSVSGWHDGHRMFSWNINENVDALNGDPSPALERSWAMRRARTVQSILTWAAAAELPLPDPEEVDQLLSSGWVQVEDGLLDHLILLSIAAPGAVLRPAHLASNALDPVLEFVLFTYADLLGSGETVARWLGRARDLILDPLNARLREEADFDSEDLDADEQSPGDLRLRLSFHSNSTSSPLSGDEAWAKVGDLLRAGELRAINVTPGQKLRGLELELDITLYEWPLDMFGALPDDRPAIVSLRASRSLLDRALPDPLGTMIALMRDAAVTFGAATGYLSADDHNPDQLWQLNRAVHQTPYERRHGLRWDGARLDRVTRGQHWGNLLTSSHLAMPDVAADLLALPLADEQCGLEQWSSGPDLWWYHLPGDPYAKLARDRLPCSDPA